MLQLDYQELKERLTKLPPLAQVAYACRCARRLQEYYVGNYTEDVAKATAFADVVAAKGTILVSVSEAAWDSWETLEIGLEEAIAFCASQSAARAAKSANFALGLLSSEESSWPPPDYYRLMLTDAVVHAAVWSGGAASYGLETWPAQIADLKSLERQKERDNWNDQVRVEQTIFGPLWPLITQSVFISYGGPDEDLAEKLFNSLRSHDVRVFFFKASAEPGRKLHDIMRDGIEKHDRVVLMCSRHSLNRPGVKNEIEKVLEREAEEGGVSRLIPIDVDGYIFSKEYGKTNPTHSKEIRRRVIADFTNAFYNEQQFKEALIKLLLALGIDSP